MLVPIDSLSSKQQLASAFYCLGNCNGVADCYKLGAQEIAFIDQHLLVVLKRNVKQIPIGILTWWFSRDLWFKNGFIWGVCVSKTITKAMAGVLMPLFGLWPTEVKILIFINLAIYTVHVYSLTVSYTLCSSMLSCSPSSLTVWHWQYSLRFREMTQMKSTKHW